MPHADDIACKTHHDAFCECSFCGTRSEMQYISATPADPLIYTGNPQDKHPSNEQTDTNPHRMRYLLFSLLFTLSLAAPSPRQELGGIPYSDHVLPLVSKVPRSPYKSQALAALCGHRYPGQGQGDEVGLDAPYGGSQYTVNVTVAGESYNLIFDTGRYAVIVSITTKSDGQLGPVAGVLQLYLLAGLQPYDSRQLHGGAPSVLHVRRQPVQL